jgi:putative transposase
MKKSLFTGEQFIYALRLAESGALVTDVCRQMGISEATFYVWKKKYAGLGVAELRQLRQLQEENGRWSEASAKLAITPPTAVPCSRIELPSQGRARAGRGA